MASAVLFERHPFDLVVRWRTVAKELSIGVLPVLGGEIVEGEQHVAVLGQAFDRLVVLRAVDFRECIEGGLGVRPGLGHPDVLERPLGFALQTLRQPVEDVGGLVHPAALLARLGPDLGKRLPEAERTVSDREFWPYRKSAPLEIEQECLRQGARHISALGFSRNRRKGYVVENFGRSLED